MSRFSFLCKRPCWLALVVLFLSNLIAVGQSTTSGWTAPGIAPGAPAGAYPLSGFENINIYNGHLSGTLPLVEVGGRGEARFTSSLNITPTSWIVESQPYYYILCPDGEDTCETWWYYVHTATPDPNGYIGNPGYGPGVVYIRRSGAYIGSSIWGGYWYGTHLTRLTFTTPDGTQIEFIDQLNEGQLGNYLVDTRGRIWTSRDSGVSATFISDQDIYDWYDFPSNLPEVDGATGYMYLKNGLTYRVEDGLIKWMRDRNGNKITFDYYSGQITKATDSLNREVTYAYSVNDGSPYGVCDRITYKGMGGATRVIRVSHASLSSLLRSGYTIKNYQQLFPELYGSGTQTFNPTVVSAVWLADGRSFQFRYNSYAELAQVQLPSGGGYQYDYGRGSLSAGAGGAVGDYAYYIHPSETPPDPPRIGIYRRLLERRVYTDLTGNVLEGSISYALPTVSGTWLGDSTETVTLTQRDSYGTTFKGSKHYFNGDPILSQLWNELYDMNSARPWWDGKEFKTEALNASGTALRREEDTWVQGVLPGGPRISDTTITLVDTNQVSKQHFEYDAYNNLTLQDDYDFGNGSPGPLLRRSTTTFITTNPVNSTVYDNPYPINTNLPMVHLRSLADQVSISNGSFEVSRTKFEYDNYATDSGHAALKNWQGVTGIPMSGYDSSFTNVQTRGNNTATSRYLLTGGSIVGSVSGFAQFDLAGNVVKTIDARGSIATIDFTDCFGAPDTDARINTVPAELNQPSLGLQQSYAFATKVTNAMSQVAYMQLDYYLGHPVNTEDSNGVVTSETYNDPLERPTAVIHGANLSAPFKTQTLISYDDVGRVITTITDRITFNDPSPYKSQTVYDGLGRTIEARQFEDASNYIASKTQYDSGGRMQLVSNAYRPWNSESPIYTTTAYDALDRITTVTTPDSAVLSTSYSGNTVTTTDQMGLKRKSVYDAKGRVREVYEDPNGLNYLTTYGYDALDNLTSVGQGVQTRSYVFDSLRRLVSATNPENGTESYQYDAVNNLIVKTDARGISAHNSYDSLNRITRRWFNGSSSPAATSNDLNLPNGVTGTQEINYFYDAQSLPSGAPSFSRGPSTGRLVAITYGTGSSNGDYFGFDSVGRTALKIQRTEGVNYQFAADYTVASKLISEGYPSGHAVNYDYDLAGRPSTFTGNLGDGVTRSYSTGMLYSPFGGLSKEQFGTDLTVYNKFFYNVRGQLSEIRVSTSYTGPTDTSWNRGAIINHFSTQCWGMCSGHAMTDNNGNIKNQDVFIPNDDQVSGYVSWTDHFDYDSLNRLLRVREYTGNSALDWQQEYDIDRYGNRLIHQTNTWGGTIPKPNFGRDSNNNRLTAPGGYNLSYDAAGNLTNDTYTGQGERKYDAENRITSAWANGQWQTYVYDGTGKRVRRTVNGIENWQVFGISGELAAEYLAATPSTVRKEYGYRNGQLLVQATVNPPTSGQNIQWMVLDQTGTPRIIVDRTGSLPNIKRHDYLPFGEELFANQGTRTTGQGYSGTDAIRQQFAHYERDTETGLDYAQFRYFSSAMGRFTGVDPVLASATVYNPQSWNRYVYVGNSPLVYMDPNGLWKVTFSPVYKKNPDGTDDTSKVDYYIVVLVPEEGDNAASLAKALNISQKDAAKMYAKMANGVIRGKDLGGRIGTVFEGIEAYLNEWLNDVAKEGAGPQTNYKRQMDCSRTAAALAFGKVAGIAGTKDLDIVLGARDPDNESIKIFAESLKNEGELKTGDIIRYAKGDDATHFTTFLLFDRAGVPQVFSKTGKEGVFEFGTANQFTKGYGDIKPLPKQGNGPADKSGYYRKAPNAPPLR